VKNVADEGETDAAHFNGKIYRLPSDAESTDFLDFVSVLDVTDRCRAFPMRSCNSSVPPFLEEHPLSYGLCGMRGSLSQRTWIGKAGERPDGPNVAGFV
jgi:hypothetical protein